MERLLLRVVEAAEIAAVSKSRAYELIRSAQWPSIRVGTEIRVPLAGLRRWITDQIAAGEIDRLGDGAYEDTDEDGNVRIVSR